MKRYFVLMLFLFSSRAFGQQGTGYVIVDQAEIKSDHFQSGSSKKTEKLTPAEVKTLSDADKELADAQAKHDATVERVKDAHGQTRCPPPESAVACIGHVEITLWGEWVLVEKFDNYNDLTFSGEQRSTRK